MSNRAIDAVRDFSKTKGSERLLLFMIAEGINKSTGVYRSSISTLMADCNTSESWIHKLITKLIQRGELIVFDNPGHSSDFAIPIYEGELGYDPQPCDAIGHTCLKMHTPLSVDRETIRRQDWAAQRRQQRSSRKVRRVDAGVDDSTPPEKTAQKPQGGVSEYTPGCIGVHPRVDDSTPPGVSEYTQYPSSTPLDLPLDVPSGSSPQIKKKGEEDKETDGGREDSPPPSPPARVVPHFAAPETSRETPDIAAAWRRAQRDIRNRNMLTSSALATWIAPLRPLAGEWHDERFLITFHAPGSDHVRIVEQRYHGLLVTALGAALLLPSQRIQLQFESASSALLEVNA